MPDSYPFPIFSGLLEPKHYKQIGTALWLFLWCVNGTTKEVEREGEMWGIVLGNKPIKSTELAEKFGVDEKTVRRWIKDLESSGYLKVTRAPSGLILTVRNSKKFMDRNVRSLDTDRTEMSDHDESDRTKTPDPPDKNVRSNKDFKAVQDLYAVDEIKSSDESEFKSQDPFIQVVKDFCEVHDKIDTQINGLDRDLMHRMIAQGVPAPLITKVMRRVFQERQKKGRRIHSFSYYRDAILEAWENEKALTTPMQAQHREVVPGTTRQPKGQTIGPAVPNADDTRKLIDEIEDARRKKREFLAARAAKGGAHGT